MTVKQPETDIEAIRIEWEAFHSEVERVRKGDATTLRKVNERLGYPLAKSVPALLDAVDQAEATVTNMSNRLVASSDRLLTIINQLLATGTRLLNAEKELQNKLRNIQ